MKKVVLKWSKREHDWLVKYPNNNRGGAVANAFLGMIKDFEGSMSKDWEGNPTGFTNLRDYLSSGGFDPDTFTISVKEKLQKNEE